jgi:hypothetical protein
LVINHLFVFGKALRKLLTGGTFNNAGVTRYIFTASGVV